MFKNIILIILISIFPVFASGGYDHGTSTGKGQLELDFTWNPFNLIESSPSVIAFGYGLTNRLDIHGRYSYHSDSEDHYYYSLFYQFADTKYLDLATAIGIRQYKESNIKDLFFPQLSYNVKFYKDLTIGGAFVDKRRIVDKKLQSDRTAFNIAVYYPLSSVVKLPKYVHEIKIALGVYNSGVFGSDRGDFNPTYSIDVTFKNFFKKKKSKKKPRLYLDDYDSYPPVILLEEKPITAEIVKDSVAVKEPEIAAEQVKAEEKSWIEEIVKDSVEVVEPETIPEQVKSEEKSWVVQVGAFREMKNVVAIVNKLESAGYNIEVIESVGKNLFLVQIVRFATIEKAKSIGEKVNNQLGLEVWILNRN